MPARYENRSSDIYCRDSRFATKTMGYISHLHNHIELGFVMGGHTKVTVDSTVYDVHGGDIIVVFPNQIHQFETVERENYILLIVDPELMPELTSVFTSSVPLSNLIKGGADDEELLGLITRISDVYRSDQLYKDPILHGYILAFFGKLLQKIQLEDIQSRDYHVLGTIINYCTINYDKNLSLSLLERELHISKYYISHVMHDKLGIGFNDYVNSLRVSNACILLLETNMTITQISDSVGFNSIRTFNRAFTKQMNVSPSAYRSTAL